jgi:hypothetical protein
VPELGFPPTELERLAVHVSLSLLGENIGTVAVNQVCKRVALGFSGLEVPSFKDSSLSDLHPLAGVGELEEGGREGRCALASHLSTVDWLAVLAWTLDDGSHELCLPWVRVTPVAGREGKAANAPKVHHA